MSSPEAALKSIENRISKLDALTEQEDIVEQNRDVLYNLKAKLEAIIHHKQDAKYLAFRKS